jgi:hypothetical protein
MAARKQHSMASVAESARSSGRRHFVADKPHGLAVGSGTVRETGRMQIGRRDKPVSKCNWEQHANRRHFVVRPTWEREEKVTITK